MIQKHVYMCLNIVECAISTNFKSFESDWFVVGYSVCFHKRSLSENYSQTYRHDDNQTGRNVSMKQVVSESTFQYEYYLEASEVT